jgi:hypothetical protein
MDLTTLVTYRGGVDYTWLASGHGTGNALSRTIDVSKLTAGTHYDANTKVVPGGLVLGKVTATGLYAPWTSGASDGTQNIDSILLDPVSLLLPNGSCRPSSASPRSATVSSCRPASRSPPTRPSPRRRPPRPPSSSRSERTGHALLDRVPHCSPAHR